MLYTNSTSKVFTPYNHLTTTNIIADFQRVI